MARMKNRLGNVRVCGGDSGPPAWISAGAWRLIDGRVKSLGDDDEERCVK